MEKSIYNGVWKMECAYSIFDFARDSQLELGLTRYKGNWDFRYPMFICPGDLKFYLGCQVFSHSSKLSSEPSQCKLSPLSIRILSLPGLVPYKVASSELESVLSLNQLTAPLLSKK